MVTLSVPGIKDDDNRLGRHTDLQSPAKTKSFLWVAFFFPPFCVWWRTKGSRCCLRIASGREGERVSKQHSLIGVLCPIQSIRLSNQSRQHEEEGFRLEKLDKKIREASAMVQLKRRKASAHILKLRALERFSAVCPSLGSVL